MVEIIGHHLHTEPVAPSLRTSHRIPADLEAVVLQCLRKTPQQRPQSARSLRDALRHCVVQPWTDDDASTWWRQFRAKEKAREGRLPEAEHALTVDVDMENRLTQTVFERV